MKNIYIKFLLLLSLLATSCKLDGDLIDPNNPGTSGTDPNLVMNTIQLEFGDFYYRISNIVDPLVRMQSMDAGTTYLTAYRAASQDQAWIRGYASVLSNIQLLKGILEPVIEKQHFDTHWAVAEIIEAYTYLTLVDVFGDIPQSEALSQNNYNPKYDKSSDVYDYAIGLLVDARGKLNSVAKNIEDEKPETLLSRDIYFNRSNAKWLALANSLELKAWVNISIIPDRKSEADKKISTFITDTGSPVKGVDLIDTEAENFTYKYGTADNPTSSRHPWYDQNYRPSRGSAAGYLGTYFLHEVFGKWDKNNFNKVGNVVQDPRWRYYFYRQIGTVSPALGNFDANGFSCAPGFGNAPTSYQLWTGSGATWNGPVFCVFEPGFWGRDHGNATGGPPDGNLITCFGVYPAGGRLDVASALPSNYHVGVARGDGANGAGIVPIYMSFFTDFLVAEILARRSADAKDKFLTAVNNSIDQVRNFASSKGQTLPSGIEPSQLRYTTLLGKQYDEESVKMDLIAKEAWISMFGNGVEAYNLYRRTSAPRFFQPLALATNQLFMRVLPYSQRSVTTNSSAPKSSVANTRVFWDTNTDILN